MEGSRLGGSLLFSHITFPHNLHPDFNAQCNDQAPSNKAPKLQPNENEFTFTM